MGVFVDRYPIFVFDVRLRLIQGINKQMKDLILRTAIFIMKDKTTGRPVVVTKFYGFQDEQEAHEFSQILKEQYIDDIPEDDVTMH